MSKIFEDTLSGLLEAIEISKGQVSLESKQDMPAPTFRAVDQEQELIVQMIAMRKQQHISQKQLAEMTGNKQQAISRIEKHEHSPSLKSFSHILHALGYTLELKKIQ